MLLVTGKVLVQKIFGKREVLECFQLSPELFWYRFCFIHLAQIFSCPFPPKTLFWPHLNQKLSEIIFRMKAFTHIYYFLQMSKGPRLGCQNVPSKKTELDTLLVAIVRYVNPKLYQDGCISFLLLPPSSSP